MNWLKDCLHLAALVLWLIVLWTAFDIASKEVAGWHVAIVSQ